MARAAGHRDWIEREDLGALVETGMGSRRLAEF